LLRVGATVEKMFGYKKSVGELAEEVGFSDANYFSRVFKNAFGMSPEKYMKFIKDV
jgi:AraC family L-rhamnose operon transcriptional activator RhaR